MYPWESWRQDWRKETSIISAMMAGVSSSSSSSSMLFVVEVAVGASANSGIVYDGRRFLLLIASGSCCCRDAPSCDNGIMPVMMDRTGRIDETCWPRGGLKEVTCNGRRWNHDSTVSACNADLNDGWTMVG